MVCGKKGLDSSEGCGENFTTTPGKIHKLYKRLFNQLEFKCPNSGHGCTVNLKYDGLDNHLKHECMHREVPCPNGCGDG